MATIFMYVSALFPAVLLFIFVWKKDQKKEPFIQLFKAMLIGALAVIPIIVIEYVIKMLLFQGGEPTSIIGAVGDAFLVAAIPEEAGKFLALWLILRKNPYFDEHFDGIVYAVCIGLGFATFENIGYIVGKESWAYIAFGRALLAVPGHYAYAVIMGYYYAVYHFIDHSPKTAACALLIPIMLHGTYDALLSMIAVKPIIIVVAFLVFIYFCIKLHKIAYTKLVSLINRDKETFENDNNKMCY